MQSASPPQSRRVRHSIKLSSTQWSIAQPSPGAHSLSYLHALHRSSLHASASPQPSARSHGGYGPHTSCPCHSSAGRGKQSLCTGGGSTQVPPAEASTSSQSGGGGDVSSSRYCSMIAASLSAQS